MILANAPMSILTYDDSSYTDSHISECILWWYIGEKTLFIFIYSLLFLCVLFVLFCFWSNLKAETNEYICNLVQDCSISIANAQEILKSCIRSSIYQFQGMCFGYRVALFWLYSDWIHPYPCLLALGQSFVNHTISEVTIKKFDTWIR